MSLLGVLLVAAAVARWRSVAMASSEANWVRFEDAPEDAVLVLGLKQ